MGRSPCCNENGIKKGPWTSDEDEILINYINRNGHGSWRALPKLAGLKRCGKSCRLRWNNYLRPDIKRGKFSVEEEHIIINLHANLGNKWSTIATHLPGRTDNEIKNFWNTHLRKKLLNMGIDPITHRPRTDHNDLLANLSQLLANLSSNNIPINPWENTLRNIQTDSATQIANFQLFQNILQVLSPNPAPSIEAHNLLGALPINDYQNQLNFEINGKNITNYSQFEDLGNSCTEITSIFPNLNTNGNSDQNIPSLLNSKIFNSMQMNENQFSADFLPSLVSFSPKCSTANQMENKNNSKSDRLSTRLPTTSNTFEANWGEVLGDEGGNTYWKEIMDQATSPPWLNS